MRLTFRYDTYQDVRHNLFLYATPFSIAAGFCIYYFILPTTHQQFITDLFKKVAEHPLWKHLSLMALFAFVAFLLIEVIKIHDRVYDKRVVKWRWQYDLDFILPRLVRPFAGSVGRRFYEVAEDHLPEAMEALYFYFVGDRELKIPKNRLVRFYERVTVYWLTQINEILIAALLLIMLIYAVFRTSVDHRAGLLDVMFFIVVAFVVNRLWARNCRNDVRDATEDEIDAIHEEPKLLEETRGSAEEVLLRLQYPVHAREMRFRVQPEYSAQSRSHPPSPMLKPAIGHLSARLESKCLGRVVDLGCGKLRHFETLAAVARELTLVDTERQLSMPHCTKGEEYTVRSVAAERSRASKRIRATTFEEFAAARKTFDVVFCIAVMDVVEPETRRAILRAASRAVRSGGYMVLIVPRNDSSILRRCTAANRYKDGHVFTGNGVTTFYRNFADHARLKRQCEGNGLSVAGDMSNHRQVCLILRKLEEPSRF